MSCHDIGRGMASVVDQIIEEVSKNGLDVSIARRLIKACGEGVNWCDGNTGEAFQTIEDNTCGCCLKRMTPKKDVLYCIVDLDYEYFDKEEVSSYYVCEDCLKKLTEKENLPFEEIKKKCSQYAAGYYYKLKDIMDMKFRRRRYEDVAKEYGYPIESE